MSSMQPLLVYVVVDQTETIAKGIAIIERELTALREKIDSQGLTRSRVQLTVIAAHAATVEIIEPTRSYRFPLSDRSPGSDLAGALQKILSDTQQETDRDRRIEVIILLTSEPSSGWEKDIRTLIECDAQVTVFAFASQNKIRDETLKRIAGNRAVRLDLLNVKTAQRAFSWIAKLLEQSVKSMEQIPHPPSPPPQASITSEAATASQPSATEPLPVSPGEREVPVSAEAVESVAADSQAPPPIETTVRLDTADVTSTEKPEVPETSSPEDLPFEEEGTSVDSGDAEQPEAAPSVEETVATAEERTLIEEEAPPSAEVEPTPEPPPIAKGGVATIWQDIDPPQELGDRVPHTMSETLSAADGWQMIGASRRGKMHAHKGIFREDAFALREAAGWHLMVVADGGGSCPLSRVGSQLAADTAIVTMSQIVTSMSQATLSPQKVGEITLNEGLKEAWKALETEADQRQVPLGHLGTTFLSVIHRPLEQGSLLGVAQVGDGLVAAELADGKIVALAEPDVGQSAGETFFLTSKPWQAWLGRVTIETLETAPRLLAAMCDGVADDFIPFEQHLRLLFDKLGQVIEQEQPEQALLELLGYEKRGSFDDRTLTLLYQAKVKPDQEAEIESATEPQVKADPVEEHPEEAKSDSPDLADPDLLDKSGD